MAGGHLRAAGIVVQPPGGWDKKVTFKTGQQGDPASATDAKLLRDRKHAHQRQHRQVSPASASRIGNSSRADSLGRNAMSIWQEMVDRHGFAGAYKTVKRFARKLRRRTSPDARAVINTKAGEEAQVDYGTGPSISDSEGGKYRRSRLFVLTLGYSRKWVRLLSFQSTRIWAELHERAFRKLGGVVKIIVPDNLQEGVLKPDICDPTLNPLSCDVLAHYDAVVVRYRPADPDRKSKVENGVSHAKKTPLKSERFESMQEAQGVFGSVGGALG